MTCHEDEHESQANLDFRVLFENLSLLEFGKNRQGNSSARRDDKREKTPRIIHNVVDLIQIIKWQVIIFNSATAKVKN